MPVGASTRGGRRPRPPAKSAAATREGETRFPPRGSPFRARRDTTTGDTDVSSRRAAGRPQAPLLRPLGARRALLGGARVLRGAVPPRGRRAVASGRDRG